MTFLAPALLALGLAATIPLVLHLLQRHQGPRVVFPALRYLRRAERESATRIRLRQVLLLMLRVLAVLLLATAAARPFLRVGGGGHAPTSVVIVLDNSLSTGVVTGERRALDELKAAAHATLEAAGPDDRFWLIRAGRSWEPAITGPASVVAEAVRRTEPAGGGADLPAELERAGSILATEPDGRAREIHVLSDLQAAGWRALEPRPDAPPIRVLRPTGTPPANRAVTAVEVGGGLPPRAGERSTVTVRVHAPTPAGADASAAAAPGDSVAVRLVVGGRVRAAGVVPPGAAALLPFPAQAPGMVTGHVELDADALAADDRRHFVAEVRPPPATALADSLAFLAEALQVLVEAGRVRPSTPGAAEVVVAPGGVGAAAVRRGASVVVLPPSSSLELAAANQRLAAAGLPFRFGVPRGGEARVDARGAGLEEVLGEARLREVYPIEPAGPGPDTVLVRLQGGEAWAAAGSLEEGGRYVVLATPLVPQAGTVPTSAAMLPLVDRAINAWAVGGDLTRSDHRPGDVVALPPGDAILRPGGARAPLTGSLFRLQEPGVYRVVRGDETVAAYAVNPPPGESDLARLSDERLGALLPERDVRLAALGAWPRVVFHRRLGREATLALVGALLLLLALESLVATAGRRRAR